jgi:hypothetical protein
VSLQRRGCCRQAFRSHAGGFITACGGAITWKLHGLVPMSGAKS